ncbi:hypothetical protein AYO52_07355 [Dietzia sp. 111N12-1]|nr:hypothetical protein AYO52_07355 [Dietzia sp. 111N12-1]
MSDDVHLVQSKGGDDLGDPLALLLEAQERDGLRGESRIAERVDRQEAPLADPLLEVLLPHDGTRPHAGEKEHGCPPTLDPPLERAHGPELGGDLMHHRFFRERIEDEPVEGGVLPLGL